MKCRFCNSTESKVIDSRPSEDMLSIRRRRECLGCRRRFTTFERIEEMPVMVVKRSGRREIFDMDKIRVGIRKACEKRPIPAESQNRVAEEIAREVYSTGEPEIATGQLGEMVMRKLKKLDEVAYVRFACVHREFKDTQTFMSELQALLDEHERA
jgi:transcriptional repressor NrdR